MKRNDLVGSAIFLAIYLLAAGIGSSPAAPWSLLPALVLAATHRLGTMVLPIALAAPFLANLVGLGGASAEGALQALSFGAAGLAMRRRRFNGGLDRPRDVLTLFGIVASASALAALAQGLFLLPADRMAAMTGLFFSQTVAGVAVFPLIPILLRQGIAPWRRWPSLETVAQVASLVLLGWEVFGQFVNEEIRFFYLLFLPFAWIAARHGVAGAAAALAATFVGLMVSHLIVVHRADAIIELQVRMLALAATGLALGAIVSERRATEEKLKARQTELAHVLRLNIGWEMASGLAHELNQPLTAAMSYGEAGLRLLGGAKPNTDKAVVAFTKGLDQIEQAGDIIRRLRDFMKKGDIRVETVAVEELVDDAIRLAGAEITASGVVIHALVPPALPRVLCDKTQIVQVILNLLRNAHQAILGSGVAGGMIEVSAAPAGDRIEFGLRDNGPGIAPEILPHLFKPFVTTKAAGMGLGLSLSKSIIEAHDGRLWAESNPHRGAIFKFTLPQAEGKED
ncbi:MAG: ATP-binding protein [Magnetospirillum sp. WYHS-4]